MGSLKRKARIAGFLYLSLITAALRLVYIPQTLFVKGDAAATASNIVSHEMLFRLGIVGDLLTGTMAIFVTLALYRLFQEVDRGPAVLIVILGALMVTPIYFLNTVNDAAALLFARGADFLSVFDKSQRDAIAMAFVRLHDHGVVVNQIFWGLWLLPFGLLIIRSRFLPRLLGVWLILNGVAHVAISLTTLLWPGYESRLSNILFPLLMGEVATMLWLIVMGAKEPSSTATVASARPI